MGVFAWTPVVQHQKYIMGKIIDCFTFFNELDLLEIRLRYLYKNVDYFVIVESDTTFNGEHKKFNLKDNINRFRDFEDKIIYISLKMKDFPNEVNIAWEREKYQRNSIKKGLCKIDLNKEDLILISDIDEIPNIEELRKIQNKNYKTLKIEKKNNLSIIINLIAYILKYFIKYFNKKKSKKYLSLFKLQYFILIKRYRKPINLKMLNCYYFINYKNIMKMWSGLQCVNSEWIKIFSIDEIRNFRNYPVKSVISGWHFSYLGGIEKIKYKIKNFSHQEYNIEEITSDDNIKFCIENGYSLFDHYHNPKSVKQNYFKIDIKDFPKDFQLIINDYQTLILD